MQMFIGSDNRGCHFRPFEQLPVIARYEIGPDLGGNLPGTLRVLFSDTDPIDGAVSRCHLASKQPDAACPHDGKTNPFRFLPQRVSP
jgi:hypothetical protein